MQPFQLGDDFLKELGLSDMPEAQKREFLAHVLETLELRVGTKLSEGMSDRQLSEFEKLTPLPTDSVEVAQTKQQQALSWLETNRPDYKDVVAGELEALKAEIKGNSTAILDNPA